MGVISIPDFSISMCMMLAIHLKNTAQLPDVVKQLLLPRVKLMSWATSHFFMTSYDISRLPMPHFAQLYRASHVTILSSLCLSAMALLWLCYVSRIRHSACTNSYN